MTDPAGSPAPSKRRGRVYWLRLAIFLALCLLAAFYVVWPVVQADQFTHPGRIPLNGASPADVGLTYQDVTLTASDGVTLAAWYVPSSNGAAVIMLHGILANRATVLPVAGMLARHGYGLLLIDMRAHGESGGSEWASWLAERDVLAGLGYLQARPEVDPARIGAWGFSAGGQTVIHAAARSEGIRAVIADGPGFTKLSDEPPPPYTAAELLLFPQDWLYITVVEQVYLRGKGTPTG